MSNHLEEFETKVRELQSLVESGDITSDEYYELVEDFKDVEKIRDQIKDEDAKIMAEKIVTHLSSIISLM